MPADGNEWAELEPHDQELLAETTETRLRSLDEDALTTLQRRLVQARDGHLERRGNDVDPGPDDGLAAFEQALARVASRLAVAAEADGHRTAGDAAVPSDSEPRMRAAPQADRPIPRPKRVVPTGKRAGSPRRSPYKKGY
jgi:hypothetical protein